MKRQSVPLLILGVTIGLSVVCLIVALIWSVYVLGFWVLAIYGIPACGYGLWLDIIGVNISDISILFIFGITNAVIYCVLFILTLMEKTKKLGAELIIILSVVDLIASVTCIVNPVLGIMSAKISIVLRILWIVCCGLIINNFNKKSTLEEASGEYEDTEI